MEFDGDLTVAIEVAWAGFRARLADRLAGMADDETLHVEVQTGPGGGPSWHFLGGAAGIRVQATGEGMSEQVGEVVARRDADRLAVDCVSVLREVHGVLHPAFLDADGLESDGDPPGEPVVDQRALGDDETCLPASHDELVRLVDAALREMSDEAVEHDGDGDIPFRAGLSVVFVRVLEERPAVELFAELVLDPARLERLPVELDILNRSHDLAKFHVAGAAVRMSYQLVAWPFSPRQLRTVLGRLLSEVDDIAEALAQRVEGTRFLEEPVVEPEPEPDTTPTHPGMVALLELLHLGPVSSPAVGALFQHDRRAITQHLTGIRMGRIGCGDHDEEEVLWCLRRGLRHVVGGEIPERRPRQVPPRPRSEQAALIDDEEVGEDTLDLGWSA